MNKKLLIVIILLLSSSITFAETVGQRAYPNDKVSQKMVDEESWQTLGSLKKELSIRNKALYDETSYKVTFIVTNLESNEEYTKSVLVLGDEFRTVIWPDDFSAYNDPIHKSDGNYKWVGIVDGKIKVWGTFSSDVFN